MRVKPDHTAFTDRMLEVLRKSPVLHLGGGKTVTLHNIRPPAKTARKSMLSRQLPGLSNAASS